jgi:hypothetical protein
MAYARALTESSQKMVQTVARQTVTLALHSLPAHNVLTASLKVGANVFVMGQSEMESVSLAMQTNIGTKITVLSAPS